MTKAKKAKKKAKKKAAKKSTKKKTPRRKRPPKPVEVDVPATAPQTHMDGEGFEAPRIPELAKAGLELHDVRLQRKRLKDDVNVLEARIARLFEENDLGQKWKDPDGEVVLKVTDKRTVGCRVLRDEKKGKSK